MGIEIHVYYLTCLCIITNFYALKFNDNETNFEQKFFSFNFSNINKHLARLGIQILILLGPN